MIKNNAGAEMTSKTFLTITAGLRGIRWVTGVSEGYPVDQGGASTTKKGGDQPRPSKDSTFYWLLNRQCSNGADIQREHRIRKVDLGEL